MARFGSYKIWIVEDLDRGRFGLSKIWTAQDLDLARFGSCKNWIVQDLKCTKAFWKIWIMHYLDLAKFESCKIWIVQNLGLCKIWIVQYLDHAMFGSFFNTPLIPLSSWLLPIQDDRMSKCWHRPRSWISAHLAPSTCGWPSCYLQLCLVVT